MGKRKINSYIKEYIKRLQKDIQPTKIILYGSLTKGIYKEGSDIDIIVVSERFAKMDTDRRLEILYRKTVKIPLDFHLHGITSYEFRKVSPLTSLGEAVKKGIVVS